MAKKLDKKDIAVLWELYNNSRLPIIKIAKAVGIPKETVKYRIEKLTKAGILHKYHAITNSSKLGLHFNETFLKLQGIPPEYEKECIKKLKEYPFTGWLISTSGPFSLCCTFLIKTPGQFYECCNYIRELFGPYLKKFSVNHAVDAQQFTYPFFKEFSPPPLRTAKHELEHDKLDKLNIDLLKILTENCRTPRKEIAKRLNTAEVTVRSRIKWLEEKHFIQQYTILLHPGRAGYYFYILFIHVTSPDKELEKHLASLPEIFYLKRKSVGFYDYKVEFYVKAESRIHEIEEDLYRKFSETVNHIDILHVKKEHCTRYFVDAQ